MAVYERVVFSQAIGALDAPTELIDNDSGNDSGPYQLTVTPGLDETAPAQIRLYDAARTVVEARLIPTRTCWSASTCHSTGRAT